MSSSYLQQNSAEFNFLKHLVLLYSDNQTKWTQENLQYYAAHFDKDNKPDDWFFDSFLFINVKSSAGRHFLADVNLGKSMSGEGDFFTLCSPAPANKDDWEELLNFYFAEKGALQTLDKTLEEINHSINKPPEHLHNVVLTLPYPHPTQERFGVINSEENLTASGNFSINGQNLTAATNSRLEAEIWFVDQIVKRWKKSSFKNIHLLGLYWIFETVYRSWDVDDHLLLKELRRYINNQELKLCWIPFYASYNFHLLENYKDYYFDMAFLQPNFLFYKDGKYIETAAKVAKKNCAGIEMEYYLELDEPISITKERHIRFREYLNAGIKYGYMNEAACAHFLGKDSLPRMYHHKDAIEREFYEDIYQFVKGTYKVKSYSPVPVDSYFKPKNRVSVAIDLGGTNLRMGVVDEYGQVIHWEQLAAPSGREAIVNSIQVLVENGLSAAASLGYDVAGVGVSSGGRVDFRSGVIIDSTLLLAGWMNVPLKKMLEECINIPVFVDNDGNCSALAERRFGSGKGVNDFISLIIGTGIGGGIFTGGKLLRGANNFASEIGHISVDADGPQCSCGNRGCVELYASGSGIVRWAKDKFSFSHLSIKNNELSAKLIGDAARAGDSSAIELLKAAGKHLGIAMAGLVNVFNPQRIILSGSLLELGDPYLSSFKQTVKNCAIKPNSNNVEIILSNFPKEAGIIGAAALVFDLET